VEAEVQQPQAETKTELLVKEKVEVEPKIQLPAISEIYVTNSIQGEIQSEKQTEMLKVKVEVNKQPVYNQLLETPNTKEEKSVNSNLCDESVNEQTAEKFGLVIGNTDKVETLPPQQGGVEEKEVIIAVNSHYGDKYQNKIGMLSVSGGDKKPDRRKIICRKRVCNNDEMYKNIENIKIAGVIVENYLSVTETAAKKLCRYMLHKRGKPCVKMKAGIIMPEKVDVSNQTTGIAEIGKTWFMKYINMLAVYIEVLSLN
jgi:hypothetical protein